MAEVRTIITSSVTLTHTFEVDEVPTDASGPVAWQLYHADGTAVAGPNGGGTAAGPDGQHAYSMTLVAPAAPDAWTLVWSAPFGSVTVQATDIIDIAGGYMFSLSQARAKLAGSTADKNRYPTSLLADTRIAVEQEAEDIAGGSVESFAFVPRFARVRLAGNNTTELCAPHLPIRKVRSVSVFGTPFSADQLAAIHADDAGVLFYPGGWIWGFNSRNIIIEYEYGLDSPPLYVRDAAISRLRQLLSANASMIPSNAIQWTTQEGGVYRLATPGVRSTGYLDIDAAYQRAGYNGPF